MREEPASRGKGRSMSGQSVRRRGECQDEGAHRSVSREGTSSSKLKGQCSGGHSVMGSMPGYRGGVSRVQGERTMVGRVRYQGKG